ncbi:hypothetical protein ES705_25930 [subsurface metagenome]
MSTWPLREVIYLALIIFNLGGMILTMRYVLKTVERDLSDIFIRLRKNEKNIAEIRGKLNGKKDK